MTSDYSDIPLILDSDIGVDIDDDLAILTLLGIIKENTHQTHTKKRIKLCAITTVGFLPSFKSLQCQTLLRLLGYDECINHIPVFIGSSTTLRKQAFVPFKLTNIVFLMFYIYCTIINLLMSTIRFSSKNTQNQPQMNAIDALIYFAKKYENTNNKLHVICIGPLTNIAKAIQKDCEFLQRIKSITIMGGLLGYTLNQNKQLIIDDNHGGKGRSGLIITQKYDTNIRSDKYAFNYIFGKAKNENMLSKLLLIPADMTLKIYLSPKDCTNIFKWIDIYLSNNRSHFMLKYVKWSLKIWSYVQICLFKCDRKKCSSYLHDPLTVCIALLFNDIIDVKDVNDFGLQYSKIEYSVQKNITRASLSTSTLLDGEMDGDLKDNVCNCLTQFDIEKMKQYICDCIKDVFV